MTANDDLSTLGLLSLLVIGIFLFRRNRQCNERRALEAAELAANSAAKETASFDEKEMLAARWEMARSHIAAGDFDWFDQKFIQPITDKQDACLKKLNASLPKEELLYGEAADLISIATKEEPEYSDLEVLRFFKVKTQGYSKVRANHEAVLFRIDKERMVEFDARPPTDELKLLAIFLGITPSDSMRDMEVMVNTTVSKIAPDSDRHEEVEAYESILSAIYNQETRATYGIKKPSAALVKKTLSEMAMIRSYAQISDDIDLVFAKLVEKKPDLEIS